MGLNESYTSVRENILMVKLLPTLNQTRSLLVQKERQKQVRSGNNFRLREHLFLQEQIKFQA